MENPAQHRPEFKFERNRNHRWGGLVLIIVGALFLLQKLPQTAPIFHHWLFGWPTILIIVGIVLGIKHRFRNIAWLILILIGSYFMLHNNNLININIRPYLLPIGIIVAGIVILTGRRRQCNYHPAGRWNSGRPAVPEAIPNEELSDNFLEVNSTFGNIEKSIFSKDFKGGKIACTFGGGQLNFAQADFQGVAIIDISITFGGLDLIIPSNWNLKNEVAVVFGSIEDKRKIIPGTTESQKTLILRGNIMFGGIEIKSY